MEMSSVKQKLERSRKGRSSFTPVFSSKVVDKKRSSDSSPNPPEGIGCSSEISWNFADSFGIEEVGSESRFVEVLGSKAEIAVSSEMIEILVDND